MADARWQEYGEAVRAVTVLATAGPRHENAARKDRAGLSAEADAALAEARRLAEGWVRLADEVAEAVPEALRRAGLGPVSCARILPADTTDAVVLSRRLQEARRQLDDGLTALESARRVRARRDEQARRDREDRERGEREVAARRARQLRMAVLGGVGALLVAVVVLVVLLG